MTKQPSPQKEEKELRIKLIELDICNAFRDKGKEMRLKNNEE